MRKASIVLAIAACTGSSLSLAQHRDPPADIASPAAAANTSADAGDNGTVRDKSGFGQVMSVLTGLLQDAAARQTTGTSSNAPQLLSSGQSAVTITVTPVAGRTTFFVDKPSADTERGPDNAIPPTRLAGTIDADAAAHGIQMAMQAEADVPD